MLRPQVSQLPRKPTTFGRIDGVRLPERLAIIFGSQRSIPRSTDSNADIDTKRLVMALSPNMHIPGKRLDSLVVNAFHLGDPTTAEKWMTATLRP